MIKKKQNREISFRINPGKILNFVFFLNNFPGSQLLHYGLSSKQLLGSTSTFSESILAPRRYSQDFQTCIMLLWGWEMEIMWIATCIQILQFLSTILHKLNHINVTITKSSPRRRLGLKNDMDWMSNEKMELGHLLLTLKQPIMNAPTNK